MLLFGILSLKDLMVPNKVVSSAYIIKLKMLLAFGKSFMYIINNKGPRLVVKLKAHGIGMA